MLGAAFGQFDSLQAGDAPVAADGRSGSATGTAARRRRHPAVPVAVAFAVGILLDRWLGPSWAAWLTMGAVLAIGWSAALLRRDDRLGAPLLLALCLCLGGARHHLFWSVGRSYDVSLFACDEPRLMRVVGRIASPPAIQQKKDHGAIAPAFPQFDKSVCSLECLSIADENGARPISGTARLSVTGHLLHVEVGDTVEVLGWLARPRARSNPGEFDFAEHVRRRGARCVLSTNDPEAVRRLDTPDRSPRRWAGRLRRRAESVLAERLSPRSLPVASAMMIGNRAHMTDDIRDAFVQSGTMHVLAISGLHVGVLALFFVGCCRLMALSPQVTSGVLAVAILGYACMTDIRPSVVRATVMILMVAAARPWHRHSSALNLLSLAALVVLVWNPTDLFDVGAQLSFLSVVALIWAGRLRGEAARESSAFADTVPRPEPGWVGQGLRTSAAWLTDGYRTMFVIWLLTAPLVAARFHLVSPVGLLINVLLAPVVVVVLWCGYGLLLSGLLLPAAGGLFGTGFDWGLRLLLAVIERASDFALGHLHVSGPSNWWLAGYCAIVAAMMAAPASTAWKRWNRGALFAWTVAGLAVGLVPARPDGLRCTFLSVGHGAAILIELPNGRTLLYDAGSLQDPDGAARTVQSALWDRGLPRIDAVVVSHADIDHFNALPELMQTVPVGKLFIARSFLDFSQPSVARCCEAARDAKVPVALVWAGDSIKLDESVSIRVLYPPLSHDPADDNSNSVVVEIEYAGRRILLTGDLEGEGLSALLESDPRKIDVMLSPHHGSLNANQPELAAWAQPDHVIVSGGRRDVLPRLRRIYGEGAEIVSTNRSGAVMIEVRPDGSLTHLRPFEPERNESRAAH